MFNFSNILIQSRNVSIVYIPFIYKIWIIVEGKLVCIQLFKIWEKTYQTSIFYHYKIIRTTHTSNLIVPDNHITYMLDSVWIRVAGLPLSMISSASLQKSLADSSSSADF